MNDCFVLAFLFIDSCYFTLLQVHDTCIMDLLWFERILHPKPSLNWEREFPSQHNIWSLWPHFTWPKKNCNWYVNLKFEKKLVLSLKALKGWASITYQPSYKLSYDADVGVWVLFEVSEIWSVLRVGIKCGNFFDNKVSRLVTIWRCPKFLERMPNKQSSNWRSYHWQMTSSSSNSTSTRKQMSLRKYEI
jgi:hypothetical protein